MNANALGTFERNAIDVVLSCVQSINDEDFAAARKYANDDMSFDGVLGSRRGADAYFYDLQRLRLKYTVHKVFVEGNDVCLLSDLQMSGKTVFVCGWYHLDHGRISSLRTIFDPRPFLEAPSKH